MAVFGMVSAVAGFVKVRYLVDKAIIDNSIFRSHYRLTSAFLFVCCIIVTANNLIGDPISCITDGAIPPHVINTYCWITSTFTLPHQQGKPVGTHVAHPGVATYVAGRDETFYHSYYQWVPFVLFLQGILFYTPHWLWKNWEEGKVRALTEGIRGSVLSSSNKERRSKQSRLVQYVVESMHQHQAYAAAYFFCELLNLANVIGNLFFVDTFLGGVFLTYGTDVIQFSGMDQEDRVDPMVAIFPRVTKCTFRKYGPSGSLQDHDALCILALNILNEKIYIFLWFWLIILSALSGLAILYSMLIIVSPSARGSSLRRKFVSMIQRNSGDDIGSGSNAALTPSPVRVSRAPPGLSTLINRISVGDFVLLRFLSSNLNVMVYREVIEELCQEMGLKNNHSPPISPPATLELKPMGTEKFGKETET
ncbi:innexin inx3 [Ischnura elegans]|uniref:innexin inx3 n=1 Tax=Ischnura elegans TaxID=197161 RepID=UPI001ED88333|nr:innexin inx3 [Ischnura elegans]XP_046396708.1 innexin inx3 [Ischnura elegans]